MTDSLNKDLKYADVVEAERLSIGQKVEYQDRTCGSVYAKLYSHEGLPNNATVLHDNSMLSTSHKPSICNMVVHDAIRSVGDHNLVIGYIDDSLSRNEALRCIRNEDSILQYNTPVMVRTARPYYGTGQYHVENHGVRFVRNLVANHTNCDGFLYTHVNGVESKQDFIDRENLPVNIALAVQGVGGSQHFVKAAALYHSDEITNVATGAIQDKYYDTRNHIVTVALDLSDSNANGARFGRPSNGERVGDVYPDQNIVIAGVGSAMYDALRFRAYQEYFQSERTGNITEYAQRRGISEPTFAGNLLYPLDSPKKYLADAELSPQDVIYRESLPLGIRIRTNDGKCVRNLIKTYNAADYTETVLEEYNFNLFFHNHPDFDRTVWMIETVGNIHINLNASEALDHEPSIAEVYGEHNVLFRYGLQNTRDHSGRPPRYVQYDADPLHPDINDYEHIRNYDTSFVANIMYPVTCEGNEALNEADIQEYISSEGITQQLADNSNNEATASVTPTLSAVGGLVLGGAIVGMGMLAFKFIKGKLSKSSSQYHVEQKNAQADEGSQEPVAIV